MELMAELFHIESLSPLYEAVQSASIFPDSKYFTDCSPKTGAAHILAAFETARNRPGFDLKSFVETHFDPPENPDTGYSSGNKPIREHLDTLWDVLTRRPDARGGTLIPLPYPYIVPGGRFREIYYWDSYFTMLGLQVSGRIDLIQNMADNFAYLIDTLGLIPNGNRSYYLGRSQPPFFAKMVELLAAEKGPEMWRQYRPALEKEYQFWMDGATSLSPGHPAHRRVVRMPGGEVLNRYWDDNDTPRPEAYIEDVHMAGQSALAPRITYRHIRAAAESGWDFSSRWFADGRLMHTIQTADLIPVDLNCLLHFLESALARAAELSGDAPAAVRYRNAAQERAEAVLKYCWHNEAGFFFDYRHPNQTPSDQMTLAGVSPLFFDIATAAQAQKVAANIEQKFLHPGGLTTTLNHTGQQWDAPNGWAPLQWTGYKGLQNYGYGELAGKIRRAWMQTCEKVYAQTGKMMEKYNVMDLDLPAGGGEYPNQDGFGWTNGVYLRFCAEDAGGRN